MSDLPTLQPWPHPVDWPPLLAELTALLGPEDPPVYLVGGAVRDALLRRPLHDLDFAVSGSAWAQRWAKRVANTFDGHYYLMDAERGVARAIITYQERPFIIDVASFRGETLADDLHGRDFSINALAVPLQPDLPTYIDLTNGLADLRAKRLRQCSPTAISSDPIRALRGVRQSVAFHFSIEAETKKAIRTYGPAMLQTSPERQRDELMALLAGPRPHVALRALDQLGLLALLLPELTPLRGLSQSAPHTYDVWEHTLQVVERLNGVLTTISPQRTDETAANSAYGMIVYLLDRFRQPLQAHLAKLLPNQRSPRALLMLAALLHDVGKAQTRSVDADGRIHFYQHERVGAELAEARADALRLSGEERDRLCQIVAGHMRPLQLTNGLAAQTQLSRRAIHRFWKATGEAGLDICLLTQADYLGTIGLNFSLNPWLAHLQTVGALLEGYYHQYDQVVAPPPLLDGRALMAALKLKPGPMVGRLLALVTEAQAAGDISSAEEAIALAQQLSQDSTPEQ
jgi:poly(A) polymerase